MGISTHLASRKHRTTDTFLHVVRCTFTGEHGVSAINSEHTMAVSLRSGSKYYYIQFQYNNKTYWHSPKSVDI